MRRIGIIISLSVLIVLLASSFSFAAGLTLESTYPEDGQSGFMPVNMAIKLKFSENITSEEARTANINCFKITDSKGKPVKFDQLYNAEKYPNEVWLQITENLTDATEYTVKISDELQSTAGNTLDKAVTLNFSTRDTAKDSNGYMVLMVLMIIGMVVFTAWDTKKKLKQESGSKSEEEKVNPYKEAKKTGKSVEEIVAKAEQQKAQAEKRRAKAGRKQSIKEEPKKEEAREGVKKVKAKRPISAVGAQTPAKVIAMKEAREKAKAAAEAKAAAKSKKAQTAAKSKGSKQQQKKKK